MLCPSNLSKFFAGEFWRKHKQTITVDVKIRIALGLKSAGFTLTVKAVSGTVTRGDALRRMDRPRCALGERIRLFLGFLAESLFSVQL